MGLVLWSHILLPPLSRQKLPRFVANQAANNIIQDGKPEYLTIKGNWHKDFFRNQNPIVLELACGRGEYSVGLAEAYPDKNFIGIDIKGGRIWKGSQYALANGLHNVGFLRTFIQNLDVFFAPSEVSEIWITFPDPRPKQRHAKRRLTHPRFLQMYQQLLVPEGVIHLKTDNTGLFDYTLDVLKLLPTAGLVSTFDLYHSAWQDDHKGIQTNFEQKFTALGQRIKYLRFGIDAAVRNLDFDNAVSTSEAWQETYDFAPTDAAKLLHLADESAD
jgi:tRNA (guanine-N7-)-methyltransferase